jgi:hypothetical protein
VSAGVFLNTLQAHMSKPCKTDVCCGEFALMCI